MEKDEFAAAVLSAEPTLYRVAKSILPVEQDCEDAVQNAVLAAWQSLGGLKEPAYFKTWLVRILIRQCYALRRRHPFATLPAEDVILDPAAEPALHDCELRAALNALPDKLRLCIVLYYIEGYAVQECAEILRLPTGTVKSRLARGRERLKAELADRTDLTKEGELHYGTV